MIKKEVPFIPNPNDRCVVCTIGMILGYYMPEQKFTMAELEKICGYMQDKGTWQTQPVLSLAKMGFDTYWIEDFDHEAFVENPKKYLSTILDKEALEWQIAHSDLELEAERMKEYLESGLPLERRQGTIEDIKKFIDDGWLVRLEVNGMPLIGKTGYDGHSVLVIDYDKDTATIHNPDSHDNRPNQVVDWNLLKQAWKEFGGSYSLYAFKK